MARETKYSTFGESVSRALADRRMTQADLAASAAASPAYVNQTMTGRKPASAEWADVVATALRMSKAERGRLHRAAAIDAGFKIDLSPPEQLRNRQEKV